MSVSSERTCPCSWRIALVVVRTASQAVAVIAQRATRSDEASSLTSRLLCSGTLLSAVSDCAGSVRTGVRFRVGPRAAGHLVADPEDGQQEHRPLRVGFELLAQVQDVHVDGALGDEAVVPAGPGQQLPPGEDPFGLG